MLTIQGGANQTIISLSYDPTGLASVDLFDNPLLGWSVDDANNNPGPAVPIILGTLPPTAATKSILSPRWAHLAEDAIYVPDCWRGRIVDFFTWIATNNGAERKLRGNFMDGRLHSALDLWSQHHPTLFNPTPF